MPYRPIRYCLWIYDWRIYAVHLLSYVLQQPICKGRTPFSANEVTDLFVWVRPARFVLRHQRIEIRRNGIRRSGKTPKATAHRPCWCCQSRTLVSIVMSWLFRIFLKDDAMSCPLFSLARMSVQKECSLSVTTSFQPLLGCHYGAP